jgi:hypothetical protein
MQQCIGDYARWQPTQLAQRDRDCAALRVEVADLNKTVFGFVMLLAVTGAAEMLGFGSMTDYVDTVLAFIWQIAIALVTFGLGLFLANLARSAVKAVGGVKGQLLGQITWWAIVLFVGALALGETGISQQLVNMAFGLTLAAIAFSAPLAFGLGGREVVGRELENAVKSFKEGQE